MDNFNIIHIDLYPNTPTKYKIKLSQEVLDIFSGSTHYTGRQVSATKTKWYLLVFKLEKAGKLRLAHNKADLFMQTPAGPQKIERLPPSEASKILGFWIDPNVSSI